MRTTTTTTSVPVLLATFVEIFAVLLSMLFVLHVDVTSSSTVVDMVAAAMVGDDPMPGSSQLQLGCSKKAPRYKGQSANVSYLIDEVLRGYDKRLRPNYKGSPVKVGITMYVSSISSISEVNMDFTLDFYFRQHWKDERLKFDHVEDELFISNDMLHKIWWPDTFFANAKSERFHETTTKNAFLRINSEGLVTQSLRLTVTAQCSMDLRLFPMDSQICSLEIESYAYSDKHIDYEWKTGEISYNEQLQLPQFEIKGYKIVNYTASLSTGNYSRLACKLYFVRRLGYYIIQIYLPSSLIVVLSWVSFWLDRTAVPARTSLGILTVLTITTLISNTNTALPKISYLKSIDIYLATCFLMVFSALLEFAAVSYMGNLKWKPRPPMIISGPVQAAGETGTGGGPAATGGSGQQSQQQKQRYYGGVGGTNTTTTNTTTTTSTAAAAAAAASATTVQQCQAAACRADTAQNRHHNTQASAAATVSASSTPGTVERHRINPSFRYSGEMLDNVDSTAVSQDVLLDDKCSWKRQGDMNSPLLFRYDDPLSTVNRRNGKQQNPETKPATPLRADPAVAPVAAVVPGSRGGGGAGNQSSERFSTAAATVIKPAAATVTTASPGGTNPNIRRAEAIDRYSRVIFPVVFTVFCSTYWTVYTKYASPNINLDGFVIK